MSIADGPAVRAVRRSYRHRGGEIDLREILARHPDLDDRQLADVIEEDARLRLEAGLAVELSRYLEAVPDLPGRSLPLDVAIEYALRWLSPGGTPAAEFAEALIDQYPELEDPIREAILLGMALESAEAAPRVSREAAGSEVSLPRAFGPKMPSSRPRYLLRKVLGEGSHGTVFLAVDRHLSEAGRPAWVAIKILSGEPTPAARQRLIDEACKARRIDHRNVVRVLDWGTSEGGEVYVVFEYVDGVNLDEWVRRAREGMRERGASPGGVTPVQAAAVIAAVARAVQAAHNAGLVHCDLKPANILVTASGEPKVADFGVAAREQELPEGVAWPGPQRQIGNLAFIAPEQYRLEEGSLAPPADVYALGGLLYYLLTGRLPNGDSAEEIARTHDPVYGRTEAPSPRAVVRGIDRDLDLICRRALAPAPKDRYASADAMANDLEAWARYEAISWTHPGPLRRMRLLIGRIVSAGRGRT